MTNKEQRGQFFTTSQMVQTVMLDLLEPKRGTVLEPSAGAGHLVKALEECSSEFQIDAVELDESIQSVCSTPIVNEDFFVFADQAKKKYDHIFGNPPYVSWKNMEDSSKASTSDVKKRYSDKSNLYHLFIDRSIDLLAEDGQMVLIVPKEWLYTSSAAPLRNKILDEGRITHIVDCGEEKLFSDADVPALLIFRFLKTSKTTKDDSKVQFAENLKAAHQGTWDTRVLVNKNSRWLLLHEELANKVSSWGVLGDVVSVKVGIVSGLDKVFRVENPEDFEPSTVRKYITTKGIEHFIDVNHFDQWDMIPPRTAAYLLSHKPALIGRRISPFHENNWWKYGAIRNKSAMDSTSQRIYAFCKTRSVTPFFKMDEDNYYGGGLLGIFAKNENVDMDKTLEILNSKDFREVMEAMFLATGNKVSLQPATLEDAPFPIAYSGKVC